MTKVVKFPNTIPPQRDPAASLQRAKMAIDTAHDLVRRSQNRISEEIDLALRNLDSQLKLVGDMIDFVPDPSARERLSGAHAILAAAGRALRLKKEALQFGGLLAEVKSEIEPSD